MLRIERLKVIGLAIMPTFLVACSGLGGTDGDSSVSRIVENAIENQVFVEGGEFELGDVGRTDGSAYVTLVDHSRPAIEVKVDSYSISRYETTWGQMRVYYEATGRLSQYEASPFKQRYVTSPTDDRLSPYFRNKPARVPNYGEAEGYCDWLAQETGLPFALPTEAQWEYAARSRGRKVAYATDSGEVQKDPYLRRPTEYVDSSIPPSGNTLMHSSVKFERRPVGSYPPNPLGLYDMTGNVAEWTQDWFQEDYYEQAPRDNPSGPEKPANPDRPEKTVRDWGGHGDSMGGAGTVFMRAGEPVSASGTGFRCVVNHPEPIN